MDLRHFGLAACLFLPAVAVASGLYRHTDANGNTVFTDRALPGSEPVVLGQGTTVSGAGLGQRTPYGGKTVTARGREHEQVVARRRQRDKCETLRAQREGTAAGTRARAEANEHYDRECVHGVRW